MIFIDTGAFVARVLASDQFHKQSQQSWTKMAKMFHSAYTSNFVINETLTLLARRIDYAFAYRNGQTLYGSRFLTILRPVQEEELKALEMMQKYADQKVSFTDCVSFVLMKKLKIRQAFGYDKHFRSAGFSLWS